MTITILYLSLLILLLLLFLLTGKYKQEITKTLDKKKHPLKFMYGTAFFLLDSFISIRKKLFPAQVFHNNKLQQNFDKLYVGKDSRKIEYLFNARRISRSILIFAIFIFFGVFYSLYCMDSSEKITSLERTGEETSYSLEVSIENKEPQIVDITVEPKEYDFKESLNLFEAYREDIVTALLGENTGIENIKYPLNFISEIGNEGLSISWEPENEELIDYSGEIHPENIETCGSATSVTACLTLGEHTTNLTIPLVLVP